MRWSPLSSDIKHDTLILGAGPAGLAAALELSKAGHDFLVIEKSESVGGLARTLQFGDFRTDIGPHRFVSDNLDLCHFLEGLLKDHWLKVHRRTKFFIHNKFFLYPVDVKNALLNVGFSRAMRIIFDYAIERFKKISFKKRTVTFQEQVISDFGRSLAEFNMINYTEKVWGLPCSQISADWLKQRINGLSLGQVVKKALFRSTSKIPKTLTDEFYYPDQGSGLIYDRIKDQIHSNSPDFLKPNSHPVQILHDGGNITEISFDSSGKSCTAQPKNVISTMPITEFVQLLRPKAPSAVLEAAQKLKFRSHVSLFLSVNKESIFPDQWIYFPEQDIPFARVTEPRNFSSKMSPPGKTSLLIEFFCWENDEIWNASAKDLFEKSMDSLEKLHFIKKRETTDYFLHREKFAYPVYDLNYKTNLEKVTSYLERFRNLQCIGRSGSFRYNNQDQAYEMGISAARRVTKR